MKLHDTVSRIETYISDYVALADPQYLLPLALWVIGSFCFAEFDSYPYLVITSPTKRSGKTRLSEILSFCGSNPRTFTSATPAVIFRLIAESSPMLIFDESERLSSEAASAMREILNVGYRKGQTIPRVEGRGVKEFPTYCPKIFILIGDVYDTLRDRSIVITMRRAEPRVRFTYDFVRDQGQAIREEIDAAIKSNIGNIQKRFQDHKGLTFLQDRDEEIWTALFCVAEVFCPSRLKELQVSAVDMATEKTQDARHIVGDRTEKEYLAHAEENATLDEYSKRLLADVYSVLATTGASIRTESLIEALKAIPTAPWRKFRGTGIDAHDLANMLKVFAVRPVVTQSGNGRTGRVCFRGYRRKDVESALAKL